MSKLLKNWKGGIDSLTQIDDILREINEGRQADSDLLKTLIQVNIAQYEQQYYTNLALEALLQQSGQTLPVPEFDFKATYMDVAERFATTDEYETIINEWAMPITGEYELINEEGSGVVAENFYLSTVAGGAANGIYSVEIVADGKVIYSGTYAEYAVISSYAADVTAFTDATYYFTSLNTIYYNKSVKIRVFGSTATFTKIYCKRIQKVKKKG